MTSSCACADSASIAGSVFGASTAKNRRAPSSATKESRRIGSSPKSAGDPRRARRGSASWAAPRRRTSRRRSPSRAGRRSRAAGRARARAGVAAQRSAGDAAGRGRCRAGTRAPSIRKRSLVPAFGASATANSGRSRTPCSVTRCVARSGTAGPSRSISRSPRRSCEHPARSSRSPRPGSGAASRDGAAPPSAGRTATGSTPFGNTRFTTGTVRKTPGRLDQAEPVDMARSDPRRGSSGRASATGTRMRDRGREDPRAPGSRSVGRSRRLRARSRQGSRRGDAAATPHRDRTARARRTSNKLELDARSTELRAARGSGPRARVRTLRTRSASSCIRSARRRSIDSATSRPRCSIAVWSDGSIGVPRVR